MLNLAFVTKIYLTLYKILKNCLIEELAPFKYRKIYLFRKYLSLLFSFI